jgi:hypothetical protein
MDKPFKDFNEAAKDIIKHKNSVKESFFNICNKNNIEAPVMYIIALSILTDLEKEYPFLKILSKMKNESNKY